MIKSSTFCLFSYKGYENIVNFLLFSHNKALCSQNQQQILCILHKQSSINELCQGLKNKRCTTLMHLLFQKSLSVVTNRQNSMHAIRRHISASASLTISHTKSAPERFIVIISSSSLSTSL